MPVEKQQNSNGKKSSSGIKLSWILGFFLVMIVLAFVFTAIKTKEEEQADNVKYKPKPPEVKTETISKEPKLKEAIQMPKLSYPIRANLIKKTLCDKLSDAQKAGIDLSIKVYNKDCKSHAFLEAAIVVENMMIENYSKHFEIEKGDQYAKIIGLAFKKRLINEEDKNRLHKINNKRCPKVHVPGTDYPDTIAEEYLDRCLAMINKLSNGFLIITMPENTVAC